MPLGSTPALLTDCARGTRLILPLSGRGTGIESGSVALLSSDKGTFFVVAFERGHAVVTRRSCSDESVGKDTCDSKDTSNTHGDFEGRVLI
jgi:hypothetical protein